MIVAPAPMRSDDSVGRGRCPEGEGDHNDFDYCNGTEATRRPLFGEIGDRRRTDFGIGDVDPI